MNRLPGGTQAQMKDLARSFGLHDTLGEVGCSPVSLALLSIVLREESSSTTESTIDRYALLVFFFSLGGSAWKHSTTWLTESNVYTWYDVACSKNNSQVESL